MPVTGRALAVRPYEPRDEPAVLHLMTAALAGGPTGQRTPEFFRWKHHDNPFGPSLLLVAESDGQVVGLRAFLRWRFRAGHQVAPAVRAVDTATAPSHQGRGIFTRLTLAALEEARRSADFVFNTPNDNSLPGYLKLGWERVGRVPVALRPIRPLRVLREARHARGATVNAPPPACPYPKARDVLVGGPAVDALLGESELSDGLRTARSLAYLRWRYAAAPGLDYRAIPLSLGNSLTGLALGRARRRGALSEFTLDELLVRKGDRQALRRLLTLAARSGCDYVTVHPTPGTTVPSSARRTGYLPVPGQGIRMVTHRLGPLLIDPRQLANWRLSLGDLEVF